MASSSISNYQPNLERSEGDSKAKKRKIDADNQAGDLTECGTRWRTESEQQIYSMKLVEALCRRTQTNPPSPTNSIKRGRSFRETADTVLATSAKGRTRWSRAILSNRLSMKRIHKRHPKVKVAGGEIMRKKKEEAMKKKKKKLPLPPFQRKVKVLENLVPGCRNLSLPNILDETADYIAALEMQIRAMNIIAGILTADGNQRADGTLPNSSNPS
ncbi:transcription factor bHLH149-like [Impatiens glandulifera]|uniref:transcription factor bHLH149-like n=1 Tax=Impatiens glandulifera TaxID=253017 RepID=UPI001FB137AA|nr:transcription factor bHLH149-like [Impatiens glandulifera]